MPASREPQTWSRSGLRWVIPALWAAACLAFILSSFPMMRPGLDIWWHLGVIRDPGALDPAYYPPPRLFWHHFWHGVFALTGTSDIFARALVIHRVQFLASFLLITGASFLVLSALARRLIDVPTLLCAAMSAAVLWFAMNGTRSVPYGMDGTSPIVQSWMIWYSVNYQISLPLTLLAIALTFRAFTADEGMSRRWLVAGAGCCLVLVFLTHMAELAYYLVALALLSIIYLRGRRNLVSMCIVLCTCLAVAVLALRYSYATPGLVRTLSSDGVYGLLSSLLATGSELRESGGTRMEYGWNILHLASLCLLLAALVLIYRRRREVFDARASLFVVATALFPLALFTDFGAGLFAFLTHEGIAYRFSFASLIFVGIPLFCAVTLAMFGGALTSAARQSLVPLLSGLVLVSSLAIERVTGSVPAANGFSASLLASLEPGRVFFGLGDGEAARLHQLRARLAAGPAREPVCTDIFTAYYLFFLENYGGVALPASLERLPGYRRAPGECDFTPHGTLPAPL